MLLGTGILDWPKFERGSDRYGRVNLWNSDGPVKLAQAAGYGSLYAVIKETRESGHIGDFFRGIFPTTPEVGQKITLGVGHIFYDDNSVGLRPADGRDSDWLNPRALYQCHEQTVELHFDSLDEDLPEVECSTCGWQGDFSDLDIGRCPECWSTDIEDYYEPDEGNDD